MEGKPIVPDVEIAALLSKAKPLPATWRQKLVAKSGNNVRHKTASIEVRSDDGTLFEIQTRQSEIDPLAFSVILYALDTGGHKRFRLRRYNGKSHGHRNVIERTRLGVGFHIHEATERYQMAGFDEDGFATATSRYSNVWQALECLVSDCGCVNPNPGLTGLWSDES